MLEIKSTGTYIENDIFMDGIKIGTVELCPELSEISRFQIYEPYQNKGYGTKVIKELVAQGYKSLWVRSDNLRAIHVYEKCGFEKDYFVPDVFPMRFKKETLEKKKRSKDADTAGCG